jgi:hypothetical protein
MSHFKYTNENKEVEEDYFFTSETLDYFSGNTFLEKPNWMRYENHKSHIIKSNVAYIRATGDTSNDGYLNIIVREGILPI